MTDAQVEQSVEDAEFEAWYAVFPRHDARKDARKAWASTKPVRPPTAAMIETLRRQLQTQHLSAERRFQPLPASYLRGERWRDEGTATPTAADSPLSAPELWRRLTLMLDGPAVYHLKAFVTPAWDGLDLALRALTLPAQRELRARWKELQRYATEYNVTLKEVC